MTSATEYPVAAAAPQDPPRPMVAPAEFGRVGIDLRQLEAERQRLRLVHASARQEAEQLRRRREHLDRSIARDRTLVWLRTRLDATITRIGGYINGILIAVGLAAILASLLSLPIGLALLIGLAAGGYAAHRGRELFQPEDQTLQARLDAALTESSGLDASLDSAERYEHRAAESAREAERRYEELRGRTTARASQLAELPWNQMVGHEFVDYVAVALRIRGYEIEPMRLTRHQGVDLIVEGSGQRIAVRVVGRPGEAIGNEAVQAVYSGRDFYELDLAAVVTNGMFAPPARVLGRKLGCALIDAGELIDLIDGRIRIEDRASARTARA